MAKRTRRLDGGVSARRAIIRWAWRCFRREWTQQALVLALLTVAVATGIGFEAALYNTTGVREQARFGTANHLYKVEAPAPGALGAAVEVAREQFGAVDVVGRWTAPLPGSVETIDFLSIDPGGSHVAPMLALVSGRLPTAPDEAALTDGLVATLDVELGDSIDLDGRSRRAVGIVENPSDLERDFVLAEPSEMHNAETAALLLGGRGGFDEVAAIRRFGSEHLPSAELTSRGDRANGRAAAAVLGGAQVVLVLVCLVASAGFAAVAQRRLRQLGVLGALGASPRHVALVVLANGAAVGLVAATVGGAVGLVSWLALAPRLEEPVGYRIDSWNLPWLLVAATVAAAVLSATVAAWLPARAAARVSPVRALARRPPASLPPARPASAGLGLIGAGVVLLALGNGSQPVLQVVGTVSTIVGVLALSPVAMSALGSAARPLPVAFRIALRDLARYRSRSALALAAVSLSLGIPVAVVIVAGSVEADTTLPNLSSSQTILWTKDPAQPDGVSPFYTDDTSDEGFAPYLPDLAASELVRLGAVARAAADDLRATAVALDVVVDPAVRDDPDGPRALTIARRTEIGHLDVALVFAATPTLLAAYGTSVSDDLATTAPRGPDALVSDDDGLWLANAAGPPQRVAEHTRLEPSYGSLPGTFLSRSAIADRGWTTVPAGWLLTSDRQLDADALVQLRDLAAREGLVVEGPEAARDLTSLRWGAMAVGALVALLVLAMTVGLIRVEAAADLRVLVATGASSRVQRTLTAATAGSLAGAGAVLGAVGAYLVLGVGFVDDLGTLVPVPVGELAVILVALPLSAAALGWLASGRTPFALAREAD